MRQQTSYPSLSATDLANAWTYAEAFPDEIEAEIQEIEKILLWLRLNDP